MEPVRGLRSTYLPGIFVSLAGVFGSPAVTGAATPGADCLAVMDPAARLACFDQAIGDFALAYTDQNQRDHAKLVAAVKAGRIQALVEEDL